jgi:hypothetical protein
VLTPYIVKGIRVQILGLDHGGLLLTAGTVPERHRIVIAFHDLAYQRASVSKHEGRFIGKGGVRKKEKNK